MATVLDDEIKAIAVSVLAEQVDKVMRPRVSSMIDIFRTHNWMSDLHFELGDPNFVVMADGYRAYENGRWVKVPTDKDLHRRITFPGKYTNARPDRFDRFLDEILCDVDGQPLPDRDQLRDLVWEMLGYCLVTHTRYEQCFIFEGPGGNGKTKIGTLAKDMVGRGNTASVQPAQMGNVFQRSHLECKLLNLVTELNQNAELEDGMFKAIVSGEMMSVEHKFQDPREIEPFAKHIILTNHMPRIRDYSDGLFRRVSIIKLLRKFDGDAKDSNLSEKLKSEIDAITSRALDALGRLIDNRGNSPNRKALRLPRPSGGLIITTSSSFSQNAFTKTLMTVLPCNYYTTVTKDGFNLLGCAVSWGDRNLASVLRLLVSQNDA